MKRTLHNLAALTATALIAVAAVPGRAQTPSQKDALKAATDRMNAIKAATGVKPTQQRIPPGDPCTSITLAAVQSLFPAVKAGERSTRLEEMLGTTECQWKTGTGDVLLVVQESYDKGHSAKEDVAGMADLAEGMGNGKNVRVETFASIGVDNAAYAEAHDVARGLPHDALHLELRKAEHVLTMGGGNLAGRHRAQVLRGLEALGKQAASRI